VAPDTSATRGHVSPFTRRWRRQASAIVRLSSR
jgi:hypothetical protein